MKKRLLFVIILILLLPQVLSKSGHMKLLAVSNLETNPKGSAADLFLEVNEGQGRVFIESFPLSKLDTQISTRFAKEVACSFLEKDCSNYDFFYTIRANSAIIGGPSAGAAIAVLTISVLEDLPLDETMTITGTINSGGIIGPVGGILEKIDAASEIGLDKVLIPKYSQVNQSNLTEYRKKYDINIIEVSQLTEAIKIMTGKDYGNIATINLSESYVETMRSISERLCGRAKTIIEEVYYGETDKNNTSYTLLDKGLNSLDKNEFYSAASYCFGSGLNSRYKYLLKENLNKKQIQDKIVETFDRANEFKNNTKKKQLKTITDLETYMVVNDRLSESKEHLTNALFHLAKNNTNTSLYELAYGIERLNSAYSWSIFFSKPGRTFEINKNILDESCLKKISEVEERIQYIEIYLPTSTIDVRQAVRKSYEDYNNGNPELCLYKASIAKAKVDVVLNNLAIDIDKVDDIIEDRSQIVKSIIAKQNQKDIFPILAYSYYEYANSLKENDKYSALLYLEYAIELGNLDIYFEKEKIGLPSITDSLLNTFSLGVLTGISFTISFLITYRLIKRKK